MQSVPAAESFFEPMRDNEQNSLNPCPGQDKAMLDKSLLLLFLKLDFKPLLMSLVRCESIGQF